MKPTTMDRDWFAQYCNMCAANVLNKDSHVRFSFTDLSVALDNCTNGNDSLIPGPIIELLNNVVNAVNKQKGKIDLDETDEHILLLTLLNIHASYLMLTRIWRYEDGAQAEDKDEYGFEIF